MTCEVIDAAHRPANNPRHPFTTPKEIAMQAQTASLNHLVDTHLAAYAEPDAARRLELLQGEWSREGRLVDPPFESRGHQGISEQAAALLTQFPGHRFERTTAVDAHHDMLRYGWRLLSPAGTPVVEGIDIADVDADGRLSRVVGFFGAQPPALA
jgi:hypothetical protein